MRNEEPRAPPCHRRTKKTPEKLRFSSPTACIARAAEDKTRYARRNVQSVCAHYKFIIQRASHTPTESRSHTLKQEKPPQNLHCGASHHPCQLFISVLSSPATKSRSKWRLEAHGRRWSLFLGAPDLLLSARRHRFNSVSVQGGRRPSRDALHLCCACETRLLIHCTAVLFKVALKRLILCKEPLFAAALSRRARRPPVMLLYLLNNACKHSGNAFSSRSIVVISHVGSLPPFAFSSSAAVAGRPGGSG